MCQNINNTAVSSITENTKQFRKVDENLLQGGDR